MQEPMQDPSSDPLFDALETVFPYAFAVVGLLVLLGFAFVAWAFVRSARAARRAGVDPFTPRGLVPRAGPPVARSLEQRLGELDDLRRRGVISDEEHRAARTRALSGG